MYVAVRFPSVYYSPWWLEPMGEDYRAWSDACRAVCLPSIIEALTEMGIALDTQASPDAAKNP